METWRPVPGLPHVEASSLGRIRTLNRIVHNAPSRYRPAGMTRLIRGQVLRLHYHQQKKRYRYKNQPAARLVCLAFHGEPPEDKSEALHCNGIATDDRPENLYWGSKTDNRADTVRHGTQAKGSKQGKAKLVESQVREIKIRLTKGERHRDLAKEYKVSRAAITDINRKKSWGWL